MLYEVITTRALVSQVASRLRRDFASLNINVEKVSPALEVDGLEATLLADRQDSTQFRVLVTTPEKLDLMLSVITSYSIHYTKLYE